MRIVEVAEHRSNDQSVAGLISAGREDSCFGAVAQVELSEDAAHVVGGGLRADVQASADLGVGQAVPEQREHLLFASGEHAESLWAGPRGYAHRSEEGGDAIGIEG